MFRSDQVHRAPITEVDQKLKRTNFSSWVPYRLTEKYYLYTIQTSNDMNSYITEDSTAIPEQSDGHQGRRQLKCAANKAYAHTLTHTYTRTQTRLQMNTCTQMINVISPTLCFEFGKGYPCQQLCVSFMFYRSINREQIYSY